MDTEELIKSVKLLMIETSWDRHGKRAELARLLKLNLQQMTVALTGYRKTPRSVEILETIKRFLEREHGRQLLGKSK